MARHCQQLGISYSCEILQLRDKKICDSCDLSLGSLEDISPAQIYCADFNSVVFFLLSFVVMYSLNETYIFFILVFILSFSYICLCISSTFSFSFCLFRCLSSTFFLVVFYLSPLIFFAYHLLSLSASVSLFVFYVPY